MKKFINDAVNVVPEALRGLARAHREILSLHEKPAFVARAPLAKGKVALLSGGGSGHEPLHAGFVGYGMLDAACPGQVFTSPTPDQISAAATAVESGRGVLFIVKNYSGDVMNFEMAAEMSTGPTATVLVQDDVAVESSTYSTSRRGVAGTLVVEKIVGAGAEAGADLASCAALGERGARACGSRGVALPSFPVPAAGKPTFTLGGSEIELGDVNLLGRRGRERISSLAASKPRSLPATPPAGGAARPSPSASPANRRSGRSTRGPPRAAHRARWASRCRPRRTRSRGRDPRFGNRAGSSGARRG